MIVDHRSVAGVFRRLALPAFAALIADQLLGIADTIVIGTLGAAALAAVTGATAVFVAILLAVHGLSRGAGILGAQAIGAGEREHFGAIVRASIVIPAACAVALAFASFMFAHAGMRALIGALPTTDAGADYLTLRCLSILPVTISGTVLTAFAAAGDTRFGLKLLVWINVVHIPLLLVLALGFGTHHPLGIVGAGIASLCSEFIGASYSIWSAWRRKNYCIFARRTFDLALAWRIFVLATPEAVYLFLVVAPDIAIVAVLAPLGAKTIAAFRVITIVSDLTWAVPGSLGEAAQIVIGQRFGAGDMAGARTFDRGARRYGLLLSTLCGIVVAAAAWPIAYVCTLDVSVASLAALPLAAHMLTLPLKGYAMLGIARIRAAGDTRFSMIVGLIASAIVIPGMWLGVRLGHAGLFAVPLVWIIAWLCWCALTAIRLNRFAWNAARLAL